MRPLRRMTAYVPRTLRSISPGLAPGAPPPPLMRHGHLKEKPAPRVGNHPGRGDLRDREHEPRRQRDMTEDCPSCPTPQGVGILAGDEGFGSSIPSSRGTPIQISPLISCCLLYTSPSPR